MASEFWHSSGLHGDNRTGDSLDDHELARRIRQGDVAAFESLYRSYWNPMYNFAFRYVQSADEAEDVVQEVFFRVWNNRAEWNVVGSVQNYLYISVRNAAIGRLRRHASVARLHDRVRLDPSQTTKLDPGDSMEVADNHAEIERALAEMPQKRRAVCALRWIDGLTYSEIAERLGITEKTVENHIGTGLKFMRERLKTK
jgi:RNA polymerase sigma-70 factor (ECF subfamily)